MLSAYVRVSEAIRRLQKGRFMRRWRTVVFSIRCYDCTRPKRSKKSKTFSLCRPWSYMPETRKVVLSSLYGQFGK